MVRAKQGGGGAMGVGVFGDGSPLRGTLARGGRISSGTLDILR